MVARRDGGGGRTSPPTHVPSVRPSPVRLPAGSPAHSPVHPSVRPVSTVAATVGRCRSRTTAGDLENDRPREDENVANDSTFFIRRTVHNHLSRPALTALCFLNPHGGRPAPTHRRPGPTGTKPARLQRLSTCLLENNNQFSSPPESNGSSCKWKTSTAGRRGNVRTYPSSKGASKSPPSAADNWKGIRTMRCALLKASAE